MSGITEFVSPSSLTSIGTGAFEGCERLTRVEFTHDINIFNKAFANCPNLNYVYYNSNTLSDALYHNTTNWSPFLHSGIIVENGIEVVIGKDVSQFSVGGFSGINGYFLIPPIQIASLTFEASENDTKIQINDFAFDCDNVICDRQAVLSAFLNTGIDYIFVNSYWGNQSTSSILENHDDWVNYLNTSFNLYIKADLEGAGDLENSSSIDDDSTIVKQSESDKEGYIKYVISYDPAS